MPEPNDDDDFFVRMKKSYEDMSPEELEEQRQLIDMWDVTVADGLEDWDK